MEKMRGGLWALQKKSKCHKGPLLAMIFSMSLGLIALIMAWLWSPWGKPPEEAVVVAKDHDRALL